MILSITHISDYLIEGIKSHTFSMFTPSKCGFLKKRLDWYGKNPMSCYPYICNSWLRVNNTIWQLRRRKLLPNYCHKVYVLAWLSTSLSTLLDLATVEKKSALCGVTWRKRRTMAAAREFFSLRTASVSKPQKCTMLVLVNLFSVVGEFL